LVVIPHVKYPPGFAAVKRSGVTITDAVPEVPSLVAVITALPTPTPVTRPEMLTAATEGSLDSQLTVRPVNSPPAASLVVAVRRRVWPSSSVSLDGLTSTLATGTGVTDTDALPVVPSQLAVIATLPTLAPVTRPDPLTVATDGLLENQVIVRPLSTFPLVSFAVAAS
jgi:hypothetical protein